MPLLVYRAAMLAWALWLALALLRWLRWGWGCFTAGGGWRPWAWFRHREAQVVVPPPSPVAEQAAEPAKAEGEE